MTRMPFDFGAVSSPFRMQPGLRRIAPGLSQLTPNRPGDDSLLAKLAVLERHAAQALLSAPVFDAEPALRALSQHAAIEHPQAFTFDADGGVSARHLGWSLRGDELRGDGQPAIGRCLDALPASWRLAGLLSLAFAEDFAVIDGNSARIPWLAVCLPSHWAPEDKVGRHFIEVHAPVADNDLLVSAAEHLARLVTGDDRWERFVWTITAQKRLDLHPRRCESARWPTDLDAGGVAAHAFFRTERQTFITLPAHRQAVFTIHVQVRPLAEAVVTAEHAVQLHAALASMSDAVLVYRGLKDAREPLLRWLEQRAENGLLRSA